MDCSKKVYPGAVLGGVGVRSGVTHTPRYYPAVYGPAHDEPRRMVWACGPGSFATPFLARRVMSIAGQLGTAACVVAVTPNLEKKDKDGAWCHAVVVSVDSGAQGAVEDTMRSFCLPDPDGLRRAILSACNPTDAEIARGPHTLLSRPEPVAAAVRPDPNAPAPAAFPSPDDVARWHDDGGRADG